MTPDDNIAARFITAAEDTADRWARARRDKLKGELGPIVDAYEQELEPIVQAMGALPDKNGGSFRIEAPYNRSNRLAFSVTYTEPAALGPSVRKISVEACAKNARSFTVTYDSRYNNDTHCTPENQEINGFADVRDLLAFWLASVAPQRIPDLKEILMPSAVKMMTLQKPLQTGGPLKLKTTPDAA